MAKNEARGERGEDCVDSYGKEWLMLACRTKRIGYSSRKQETVRG